MCHWFCIHEPGLAINRKYLSMEGWVICKKCTTVYNPKLKLKHSL